MNFKNVLIVMIVLKAPKWLNLYVLFQRVTKEDLKAKLGHLILVQSDLLPILKINDDSINYINLIKLEKIAKKVASKAKLLVNDFLKIKSLSASSSEVYT